MPQALAFWNQQEAFVFLSLNTTGRAQNMLQEKLAGTRYGYLSLFLGNSIGFTKQNVVAYHLSATGQLDRFALPDHTMLYGSWSVADEHLQLTPPPVYSESALTQERLGFRWDGSQFLPVSSQPQARTPQPSKLNADDDDENDEDEDADYGVFNKTSRQQLKAAGWQHKVLTAYNGGAAEATLPFALAGSNFGLTVESPKPSGRAANFDFLMFGVRSIRLSGDGLGPDAKVLWTQSGWQPVTKSEYESLAQKYGLRRNQPPFMWVYLVILAALIVWKFAAWFEVLFTFGTMKRRILKNMPTSYSFPPATPAQFPALDIESLDRYTRELEGMGFNLLLDFSLVSDSPNTPPSFCRLFAHTRHHCFGTITQFFPRGKAALPIRCGFEGCLQDGWSMGFTNGKPQAAGSLLRRRKALGASMPGVTAAELLQAFLKMREQVCMDLGISPVNDDTLQAFMNKTQRSASELKDAVQQKNFIKGLPEVYLRKFALPKTQPEYIWLGDYPKEAERRKQGLSSFATAGR
jgi:hypothetical protein